MNRQETGLSLNKLEQGVSMLKDTIYEDVHDYYQNE
jgi:hypothetical protein